MKAPCKLLVFFLLAFTSLCSYPTDKVVRISTLGDYAPFCMIASDTTDIFQTIRVGEDAVGFSGYAWDVVRESFHVMGYTIKLRIVPWPRSLYNVKTGNSDIVFPISVNSTRAKIFNFSNESVLPVNFVIYSLKESSLTFNDMHSLNGLVIALKRGFNYSEQFNQAVGINKQLVSTIKQGFKMLALRRVDGFIGYEQSWDYYLNTRRNKINIKKSPTLGRSFEYLAALKGSHKGLGLLKIFDSGKQQLQKSGKLQNIGDKWSISQGFAAIEN